jgi:formate--tetrahydrofolate ligase
MAMHHADWAITEAGFGFDLGAEKFLHIKCRQAGLEPAAVVMVTTVRALKMHGGLARERLQEPNLAALRAGFANLDRHVESCLAFGKSPVVALNRFAADTDAEVALVREHARDLGVRFAEARHFAEGGAGAVELAREVMASVDEQAPLRYLYDEEDDPRDKVRAVAQAVYGARGVIFSAQAERDLALARTAGLERLPVCIAKTPHSLSDDPKRLGRPRDFDLTVRNVQLNAGAGFLVVLTGDIVRMPGLPRRPQALRVSVNPDGTVEGVA